MPPLKFPAITLSTTVAEPEGDEIETACACCAQPIFWGHGWLTADDRAVAAYWYHWSSGHAKHFTLKVALFDDRDTLVPGVISVRAHLDAEAIHYAVLEPDDAVWTGLDLSRFGAALGRAEALAQREHLFAVVDAVAARDGRLASRILGAT